MDILRERRELKKLLGQMPRSRHQLNGLFEADTEILRLGDRYLAMSTDSVGEEITQGLYRAPALWGWMTVISSVSDLAASGTHARGLLLSTQWAFGSTPKVHRAVMAGARAALRQSRVALLGGDSGWAKDHVLTSTILGDSTVKPLTRLGAKPGDRVFLHGRARTGLGPVLAFQFLAGKSTTALEKKFRPRPSWEESLRYRPWLKAAIDTSDGIASSLAILGTLNQVGFRLTWNPQTLSPIAVRACRSLGLPLPLLWMGDHGDFQTMVITSSRHAEKLRRDPNWLEIGIVTRKLGMTLVTRQTSSRIHRDAKSPRYEEAEVEFPADWVTQCARNLPALEKLIRRLTRHFKDQDSERFYS